MPDVEHCSIIPSLFLPAIPPKVTFLTYLIPKTHYFICICEFSDFVDKTLSNIWQEPVNIKFASSFVEAFFKQEV